MLKWELSLFGWILLPYDALNYKCALKWLFWVCALDADIIVYSIYVVPFTHNWVNCIILEFDWQSLLRNAEKSCIPASINHACFISSISKELFNIQVQSFSNGDNACVVVFVFATGYKIPDKWVLLKAWNLESNEESIVPT